MKTSWLILLALATYMPLAAQRGPYIGVVPLDSLAGQYLQMSLISCYRQGHFELHIQLHHGLSVPRARASTRPHATNGIRDTYILKTSGGEWITVSNHIAALDLMYQLGWELYGDPPRAGSGVYMLKRRPVSSR